LHFNGDFMISTAADTIVAEFNCFDPIDEDDFIQEITTKNIKGVLFEGSGYGSDTFEEPELTTKKTAMKKRAAKPEANVIEPLDDKISDERRVQFYTRIYEPSHFDKDARPQWTPSKANNDNHKGKHSFPALAEARNNTLMLGRNSAHTLIQNEWAFDILIEINELLDAAAPTPAWCSITGTVKRTNMNPVRP
jgi:hypothetical protein